MGFLDFIFGAKTHKGYTINYNYPYWMKCPCSEGQYTIPRKTYTCVIVLGARISQVMSNYMLNTLT